MRDFFKYNVLENPRKLAPNIWDMIALVLVFAFLALLALGARQMSVPYHLGQSLPISLSPHELPIYASQTVLRMLIALFFSLLFTFTVGTIAAKNKHAEKIIVPVIDVLQSVPVMGFLSITVVGFIALFPGSLWGAECAAIFAIFTSQVWNMVLSFYQSMRTVPLELREAADVFQLSAWQRFWRVEVPFAMPGLLWNTMLSMSASWFFVVASEAVTVNNQTITLPGIGSYLAIAIAHKNIHAVLYTVLAMLLVIFLYDQLLFRPLIKWSERFRMEQTASGNSSNSWIANLFRRTVWVKYSGLFLAYLADKWVNLNLFNPQFTQIKQALSRKNISSDKTKKTLINKIILILWYAGLVALVVAMLSMLVKLMYTGVHLQDVREAVLLGFFTALRVFAIVLISTLVWVPLGVWIGLRPRLAEIIQPLAQFLAAFPVNILFPLFVIVIMRYKLNVDIWTTPLMLLGTQWYILFNVITGAAAIPKELKQAADNFGVKGFLWWYRLILPGIFPYYITGAITAVGNAWNTSTIAEVISWGNTTLEAHGLGAYIMTYSAEGNFPHLVLGICVMSLFVLTLNRLLWRPLYEIASTRYRLD